MGDTSDTASRFTVSLSLMTSWLRSLRPIHFAAAGVVALVVIIGASERRPALLDDFDSERDAAFADTWENRVHLAYWEKWGSFERDACQAMVDAFNRSQDRIYVHYINTSQVDRKAMLAIMGGSPPDVVGLWANNVPHFAEAGALMRLDGFMASAGLSRDRYIDNYLKLGMYDDSVFALPTSPASVALFYNREHFAQRADDLRAAGLDPDRPPATFEELDRYAGILNEFDADGRPVRMGFLPTEPGWFNWTWGFYFGGTLFDEATGTVTADAPGNVEALVWAKRYAERYGREKLLQFRSGFGNFDSPQNAFMDGKVSMEVQGVWFPNFIRRHRPHMEFGVAPPPIRAGLEGPISYVECDVIAIPRGCPHPDEAWEFVRYSQLEGSAILNRLQGKHLPARDPPESFRTGHPNLELDVFERVAASPHSFIQPRTRIWMEYRHEMDKAFEHIWNWRVEDVVPDELTGPERAAAIDRAVREEARSTLADIRERMQRQYDLGRERERKRSGE